LQFFPLEWAALRPLQDHPTHQKLAPCLGLAFALCFERLAPRVAALLPQLELP
jgi:hypothetical protein